MNRRKSFSYVLMGLVLVSMILILGTIRAGASILRNKGETLQAGVALSPGYLQEAMPGHVVAYTHILTNTQIATDTFSLMATSSQDWTVVLFDASCPFTPLLPLQLGPGMTATIGVSVTVPTIAISGTIAHTTITATSLTSETVQAAVTDVTLVYRSPGVALSYGQSKEGVPGSVVTFTHIITNTGPITDVFALESKSQHGWVIELLEGSCLTCTVQIQLGELDTFSFVVSTTIPGYIPGGTVEHIVVTATSLVSDIVTSTVTDTVTVQYTAFLPLVQGYKPPQAKLGADFGRLVTDPDVAEYDFPLAKEMGANWVRVSLPWLEVEVSPGQYNWDEYDMVFDGLRQLGFRALVVVYGAPEWAAEEKCGPISDTLALENLLDLVVPRYGDIADAWEFINEPDGKAPQDPGPVIGCWGLHPIEYAQQLQIFHDKVRSLDPGALVFFGGLAYDNWEYFERSFFEKTLQNGAGSFFDGVSLHYYPINPVEFPTMAHKVNEIRDTMSMNGVYNKLIWITETSMWVNPHPVFPGSLEAQRNYIVQELSRGYGAGVDNILWFETRQRIEDPPLHTWLISLEHEPDNGYYTFQHFARKLEGLYCVGAYRDVPTDVEAYEFTGLGRSLYVLWSNTVTETASIPSSTDAILTSRDGDESVILPVQEGKVTFEVGTRPVFVEIAATRSSQKPRNGFSFPQPFPHYSPGTVRRRISYCSSARAVPNVTQAMGASAT